MGPIGVQEMMLIFVLALLLFGPKKLPELGRMLGKGLSEFRRAKNELKATFETHLHELEKEARVETQPPTASYDYSAPHYPQTYDEQGQSESSYSSAYGSSAYQNQETAESQQAPSSQPSTASATATQDAEANRDSSSPSSPVAGTVARANGVQPIEPLSTAAKEEHPA
jgi:sec-independent protein translocase protein TatA